MKPVTIHSAALAELEDAIEFYTSRSGRLGLDLLDEVEKTAARIRRNPEGWPIHKHGPFRKCLVDRFPFVVFYIELPDVFWIAAIAHAKRRPDYWRRRMQEF